MVINIAVSESENYEETAPQVQPGVWHFLPFIFVFGSQKAALKSDILIDMHNEELKACLENPFLTFEIHSKEYQICAFYIYCFLAYPI